MAIINHTNKNGSKIRNKRFGILLIVVSFGTLTALSLLNVINLPYLKQSSTAEQDKDSQVNYDPPTEQEKTETQAHKENLEPEQSSPSTPQGGQKRTVTPTISSWGTNPSNQTIEVAGFISGIIEEGGTCTLTLSKDVTSVTESQKSVANAQTVSCGFIGIPRNRLSPGLWKASITYNSNLSEGKSNQDVTVEVK